MSFTESEELNKWIHRSYEIGKREERERIIKLLEENLEGVLRFSNVNVKTPTSPEIVMSSFTGDIISLIKGEN